MTAPRPIRLECGEFELTTPPVVRREAVFSLGGVYRYRLIRRWDDAKPHALVLGINPSSADGIDEDQTSRKTIGFGLRLGWGGYTLANPFAAVSTDQRGLLSMADPVGPNNDDHLADLVQHAQVIVCAWGSAKTAAVRRLLDARLRELAPLLADREIWCLGTSADGSPRHPLMLAYDTPLERFRLDHAA